MPLNKNNKFRILLLSGYDAASHRYWRNTLVDGLDCFIWTEIALPDRYFSWRIRGNALSFAFQYRELLVQQYDCLLVTSMVDLAGLRGFIPQLADIPNIVYFHENQFDYPLCNASQEDKQNIVSAQLTSIYSLLSANKVLFNSKYNQETFFRGAQRLLKKLPDGIAKDLLKEVKQHTQVLPVPILNEASEVAQPTKFYKINQPLKDHDPSCFSNESEKPIQIVWNHRWQYDKQPEVFFAAMELLKNKGVNFEIHVLGQSFRQKPACFQKYQLLLADHIATWGFQPKDVYQQLLLDSDIVVSTALHDFQGLSMLEAIVRGCHPVAPNRVAYPEYIAEEDLYNIGEGVDEAQSLYKKLLKVCHHDKIESRFSRINYPQEQSIKNYLSSHLLIKYRQVIEVAIAQFNTVKNKQTLFNPRPN